MRSNFSYRTFFRGSTVMVVVPHEDDEINIAGSVIWGAKQEGLRVICVFLTNGDYEYIPEVRIGEAMRALAILGVGKDDVVFLGYPDGGVHAERSVFQCREQDTGEMALEQTRGTKEISEFYFAETGQHHAASWTHLLSDLEAVIDKYRPEGIISVDLDSHPDHRMCSVACDRAIGRVINRMKGQYTPVVLKAFAYNLAFEGVKDFYQRNLLSTKVNQDKLLQMGQLDNPQLEWEQRVRLPVPEACRTQDLSKNRLFQALSCHMSQKAMRRAEQLINGDQVFWQRRTDSLLFAGNISVSSGNGERLHDFCLVDFQDIASPKPTYGGYLWRPEKGDEHPWCRCDFNTPQDIEAAAFYGESDGRQIAKGRLSFSTGFEMEVGPLRENGRETYVEFPRQIGVRWVRFEILGRQQDMRSGLAEWELFSARRSAPRLLKICVNGEFAYEWLFSKKEPFYVDAYNPSGRTLHWWADGQAVVPEQLASICQQSHRPILVRVEAEGCPDLWDEALLIPLTAQRAIARNMLLMKSRIASWWENQKEKRPHHQLKKYKVRR